MKEFFLEDAKDGLVRESFFLVQQRRVRTRKNGQPYLALTLTDKTGSIETKVWDSIEQVSAGAGDFVKAKLCFEKFNDQLQAVVISGERSLLSGGRITGPILRVAEAHEFDRADFLPATNKDVDQLWQTMRGAVSALSNVQLRALLDAFLDDPVVAEKLRHAPAARSLHHAWLGGLLEHKVELVELCNRVAPLFADLVQQDLLVAGAVLHDIGKIYELTYDTGFNYTIEGQLLGHISIGQRMLREKAAAIPGMDEKLVLLLEHMVLSHHGHYEFGSAKLPMIPEAMMLHMLDDLCAKMELFRGELASHARTGNAAALTGYIRALERPILDSRAFLHAAGDEKPAAEDVTSDPAIAEAVGGPAVTAAGIMLDEGESDGRRTLSFED